MVAVTRALGSFPSVPERRTRSSSELDANLRTYRAQMADWVTCPSAKTPEGKAKIQQISAKLDSVKREIRKSDSAEPSAPNADKIVTRPKAMSPDEAVDYRSAPNGIGLNVDTYA